RKLPESRTEATERQVSEKVAAVKESAWNKFMAWLVGIPALIGSAFSGATDYFSKAFKDMEPIKEWFSHVPGWACLLMIFGLAVIFWWRSNRAAKATIEMYQQGRVL